MIRKRKIKSQRNFSQELKVYFHWVKREIKLKNEMLEDYEQDEEKLKDLHKKKKEKQIVDMKYIEKKPFKMKNLYEWFFLFTIMISHQIYILNYYNRFFYKYYLNLSIILNYWFLKTVAP